MTELSTMDADVRVSVAGRVSIARAVADARAQALSCRDTDPAYAELMATYAALGDLLDTDPDPDECAALLRHSNALSRTVEYHAGQRRARWLVQHTTFEGGA